ncbi:MAG: rRNA (guanine1516-N2)-methyltransferase [Bradyrhizobium sp.]|nr:rRNA (guanine1516-N2)-methyltransferase [Bradyrhizobium sp.]
MNPVAPLELVVDFVGGAVGHRFRSGARDHALLKATAVSKGHHPNVIDATAGLGRDSFLLASLGANVTLLERSAEVHALLERGLATARAAGPELAEIVSRMTLIHGDARDILPRLHADAVMVDPMHPARKKTALVKKEMRLLRQLVGTDPDVLDLMQAALACNCKRVVLKWPLRADPIPELRKPSYQILGKTVRYDVFAMASATV